MQAYARLISPRLSNRSLFDLFVVTMSLIALGPINLPISILRLMRAFRIVRIFGRVKALRNIIAALTASMLPVLNAFVILLVIASICALPAPCCVVAPSLAL
jgi:hypothetical protein